MTSFALIRRITVLKMATFEFLVAISIGRLMKKVSPTIFRNDNQFLARLLIAYLL